MRAGQLRHRIAIERVTETQSSSGAAVPAWSTFAERYAAILPQDAREALAAKQAYASLTHLVELRYVAGVTAKMRLVFGSRVFDILGVIREKERAHEMRLACLERNL